VREQGTAAVGSLSALSVGGRPPEMIPGPSRSRDEALPGKDAYSDDSLINHMEETDPGSAIGPDAAALPRARLRVLGISSTWSEFKLLNTSTRLLVEDDLLLWRMGRNLDEERSGFHVRTDAHGFRCGERCPRFNIVRRRIFRLGGSVTFGWGVNGDETFAARLEALYRERGCPGVEVVNAGVMAYTSEQALLLFTREILPFRPWAAIVALTINDQQPVSEPMMTRMARRRQWRWKMRRLLMRSLVFRSAYRLRVWLRDGGVSQGPLEHANTPLDRYRRNLERFVELCRDNACRLVLVSETITTDFDSGREDPYRQVMEQVAAAHDLPYLNTAEKFAAYLARRARVGERSAVEEELKGAGAPARETPAAAAPAKPRKQQRRHGLKLRSMRPASQLAALFVDDWHPNARGHRLIGGWLFELLQSRPDTRLPCAESPPP